MKLKSLVFALTLLVALTTSAQAQGPPPAPPGNLNEAVVALMEEVDALEVRAALLESENASQAVMIAAIELELGQTDRAIPTGTVVPFAGPVGQIPDGWLLGDGTEIDRVDYADLFAAIGTAHGEGDGASTFQLPDYRGMFLRGVDYGRSLDPDRTSRSNFRGGSFGDQVGSLQGPAFSRHGHSLGAFGLCDASGAHNGGLFPLVNIFAGCHARTVSGTTGGNETRPWNVYVNFIIKY